MVSPFWCFGVTSLFGLLIFVSALYMHKGLEIEGDYIAEESINQDPNRSGVRIRTSFCEEIANNFYIACTAIKVKEFRNIFLWCLLSGLTVPTFGQYQYYFLQDELGIDKFTYGLLFMASGIFLTIGVLFY